MGQGTSAPPPLPPAEQPQGPASFALRSFGEHAPPANFSRKLAATLAIVAALIGAALLLRWGDAPP